MCCDSVLKLGSKLKCMKYDANYDQFISGGKLSLSSNVCTNVMNGGCF